MINQPCGLELLNINDGISFVLCGLEVKTIFYVENKKGYCIYSYTHRMSHMYVNNMNHCQLPVQGNFYIFTLIISVAAWLIENKLHK